MVPHVSDRVSVSIGIPFFNARRYLADAVRSVFAQTHDDWELLLVNDGSSDASADTVLHRYGPPLVGRQRTRPLVMRSRLKSIAYRVATALGRQDRLIRRRNRPVTAAEIQTCRRILSAIRNTPVPGPDGDFSLPSAARPLQDGAAA